MRVRHLALAAIVLLVAADNAGLAAAKAKRRKVLRRVKKERGDGGGTPAVNRRTLEVEEGESKEEREARSIERDVGLAGTLVPSQPEPPADYLPYHYSQQKYRTAATSGPEEYYVDARDLLQARDLVALESQIAEDIAGGGYNEPQYDTTSYVYGGGDGGGADFNHAYMYPYDLDPSGYAPPDQVGYAPPSGAFAGGNFLQVNNLIFAGRFPR